MVAWDLSTHFFVMPHPSSLYFEPCLTQKEPKMGSSGRRESFDSSRGYFSRDTRLPQSPRPTSLRIRPSTNRTVPTGRWVNGSTHSICEYVPWKKIRALKATRGKKQRILIVEMRSGRNPLLGPSTFLNAVVLGETLSFYSVFELWQIRLENRNFVVQV